MQVEKDKQPIEKIKDSTHQAVQAESVSTPVRRYRAILFQVSLLVIAGAFGVLTFLVKTTPSFAIDLMITRAIQQITIQPFPLLMSAISWPGFFPQSVIIPAVIILIIYAFGLHWEAMVALSAAVFSTAINILVKDLVQRSRPLSSSVNVVSILNSYSFPSGHVMFYLGFFGFIVFLSYTLLKPSVKRTLLLIIFGSLIVLVGISRVYLGQHWASDVLGAYLLASLTLIATISFYRWGKTRFFVHQPVAAEKPEKPDIPEKPEKSKT